MADDAVQMLSPLKKEGHNLKGATQPGRWTPLSGTLGELGKALDVDDQAKVDIVRSTPDPWSQPRSFADAVLNPSPLHSDLVGQWRGLLALFGLSAYLEDTYKLTLTAIPLGERHSRFADVMKQLLPKAALAAPAGEVGHGWDRPVLVRLFELNSKRLPEGPGKVIGLLNPACLIAGARDVERLKFPAIAWMRDGLRDPTRLTGADALPMAALKTLAEFLDGLDRKLADLCGGKGDLGQQEILQNLRSQLQSYRKDCSDSFDPARHPGVEQSSVELETGDLWAEGLPHLYQLLATPIKAKAPKPGTSDCIIRLRDDLGEPAFKGLVLLDAGLATPERPASRIAFWGLKTLQQVLSGPDSDRQALREDIAKAGYLLVTPDDFFTRVLVRMDDEERPAAVAMHPEGLRNCLLPLSPLALLVRKPEDIASGLTINRDGKVALNITVGTRPYALSKRFAEAPQTGEGKLLREVDWGLGDFALWPNFRSDVWKHYFARIDFATNSLNRLRGRFALSGKLLTHLLRETQAVEKRPERIQPWLDNAPLDNGGNAALLDRVPEFSDRKFATEGLTRFRASNSGGKVSEIQIATAPFEAGYFSIVAAPDEPPVPAGMSLFNLKEVINPSDKAAPVAIDFGTTNTVACLDDTGPVKLEARICHPIEHANSNAAKRSAAELTQKFRDFLPPDTRELPTPTVLIGRPLDAAGRELLQSDRELNDLLLMRHLIYFQPDFAEDGTISAVPLAEWSALLNNIQYNLKWAKSEDMRDAARRYLRQLMLMIACEWAARGHDPAKLSWHFSRPEDMVGDPDFVGQLQNALEAVVRNPAPQAIRPIRDEGNATAAYILDEKTKARGTRGALNIILDIGGGTTDIAIWDNGAKPKSLLSTSMRLAGGDFFTGHIMRNPEILEKFGLAAWSNVIQQLNREGDASLKANIHYIGELLFSGDTLNKAIEREWSRVSGTDDIRRLKETAYLFLGGVAWFVGRQIRNLIRDGIVRPEALGDISLAFCGRGSGLFRRLHGDDPHARTDISKILLLIAVAAGDPKPRYPQVQVSPVPKIEVAAGMIILARQESPNGDAGGGGGAANDDDSMVFNLGVETGALGGLPVRAENEPYKSLALDVGIEDLDIFLKAFAQASGFEVKISDNQRAKLINAVADLDREDARAGLDSQSEFSAVLKALVGLIRVGPDDPMRPSTSWA